MPRHQSAVLLSTTSPEAARPSDAAASSEGDPHAVARLAGPAAREEAEVGEEAGHHPAPLGPMVPWDSAKVDAVDAAGQKAPTAGVQDPPREPLRLAPANQLAEMTPMATRPRLEQLASVMAQRVQTPPEGKEGLSPPELPGGQTVTRVLPALPQEAPEPAPEASLPSGQGVMADGPACPPLKREGTTVRRALFASERAPTTTKQCDLEALPGWGAARAPRRPLQLGAPTRTAQGAAAGFGAPGRAFSAMSPTPSRGRPGEPGCAPEGDFERRQEHRVRQGSADKENAEVPNAPAERAAPVVGRAPTGGRCLARESLRLAPPSKDCPWEAVADSKANPPCEDAEAAATHRKHHGSTAQRAVPSQGFAPRGFIGSAPRRCPGLGLPTRRPCQTSGSSAAVGKNSLR